MPELRYIQRDADGKLIGHFANPQPYATEAVPEDHPDILAWSEKWRKLRGGTYGELLARIEALEAKLK